MMIYLVAIGLLYQVWKLVGHGRGSAEYVAADAAYDSVRALLVCACERLADTDAARQGLGAAVVKYRPDR